MLDQTDSPAMQVKAMRQEFDDFAAGWRLIAANSAPHVRAEAEVQIFNQLVVALEGRLGPRLVGSEIGHGHAATELHLLARGVQANGGRFPGEGIQGWRPDASVTGYRPRDRIAVTEEMFRRLAGVILDGVARSRAAYSIFHST